MNLLSTHKDELGGSTGKELYGVIIRRSDKPRTVVRQLEFSCLFSFQGVLGDCYSLGRHHADSRRRKLHMERLEDRQGQV